MGTGMGMDIGVWGMDMGIRVWVWVWVCGVSGEYRVPVDFCVTCTCSQCFLLV